MSKAPRDPADPAKGASGAQDEAERPHREPIDPPKLNWRALSPEARRALREVALPVSLGRSYDEISKETGVSVSKLAAQMKALREELREGMREPDDEEVSQEGAFRLLLDAAEGDVARVAYALGSEVKWVEGKLAEIGLESEEPP
jgi:hypothetical protein